MAGRDGQIDKILLVGDDNDTTSVSAWLFCDANHRQRARCGILGRRRTQCTCRPFRLVLQPQGSLTHNTKPLPATRTESVSANWRCCVRCRCWVCSTRRVWARKRHSRPSSDNRIATSGSLAEHGRGISLVRAGAHRGNSTARAVLSAVTSSCAHWMMPVTAPKLLPIVRWPPCRTYWHCSLALRAALRGWTAGGHG